MYFAVMLLVGLLLIKWPFAVFPLTVWLLDRSPLVWLMIVKRARVRVCGCITSHRRVVG